MIEITAEIRAFIDKAAAGVELAEDEYIDLSDGLIHCKKCGGQRQTVVPCFGKSGYFMPHCICQCQREAEEQRKAAEERQRRMERIKRRKAQGLQDRYLYDYTFSNDNRQNPLMDKAHAYVENWKEAYKSNIGLLLFGDVGTGKSFFAGCIANALLDQDVPVLMTNFPTILNRLTGMFSEDRSEFIASFDEYDLLIIDDLGLARDSTEELALLAALGRELDGHVLELAAHFDGGLTVRGLLGAAGLFLQVHGVDGVSRGEHGELAGQQEVSCIALGCVDELALFALTPHILR